VLGFAAGGEVVHVGGGGHVVEVAGVDEADGVGETNP
jgi:hypothetical protein